MIQMVGMSSASALLMKNVTRPSTSTSSAASPLYRFAIIRD